MIMALDVAVVVGSLRTASYSRKLAKALAKLAPGDLQLDIVEIGALPHYNQDDESQPAAAVTAFRERIKAADAVLFVTPEYNRSLPGVLKNAIDTGSRPYGQSIWNSKPAAVISQSQGAIGGFGANHHLRQSLAHLNMPTLGQPEVYLGFIAQALDDDGGFAKPETMDFMLMFLKTFESWIRRHQT